MEYYQDFAQIYDELINEDVDYELWSKYILSICEENHIEKKDYLDLACGTGNLTFPLMKSFTSTYAVDLSQEMLSIARDKVIASGYKPKFICQDITELELNKEFDLITCCLDGVNYILDENKLKDFFNGVSQCLKDNGLFIFDINSYYKLSKVLGNNIFTFDNDEVVYMWENTFEDNIVDMYLTFFLKENGDIYHRFDEEHKERAYKEEEIEALLEETGLRVYEKLENYTMSRVEEDSERIVYVVGK